MKSIRIVLVAGSMIAALAAPGSAADGNMSFFVTSVGGGNGADLGGLEGADAHCTKLAEAAGVTGKTWRAYLSTTMLVDRSGGRPYKITPGVNARDRIGNGPWHNANGEMIAMNIEDLHSASANVSKSSALD